MTPTEALLDTGYPNSLRPELHKALKARGIDYWCAQGITFWSRDDGCECLAYGYKANGVPKLAVKVVGFTDPEQAIAATEGRTVWEPSKEWKSWHESLKHDNPTNIREAVENILFDAIDFGGDMGPNGNVWSGVDEGDVLTEKCIDGWVRSIELVAATVGAGTLTAEQVRECAKGVYFEGYSDGATHRAHGIEETDWQTIADKLNATLGVGTCYPVPIYSFNGEFTEYDCDACSECGTEWDGDMPKFCPNCGRRVMEADE